jgi:hypothetical protein
MEQPPDLRVSDRDREATVERLRHAAGEGRLDADELEARTGNAFAARTRSELEVLTRDLPPEDSPAAAPHAGSVAVGPELRQEHLRRRAVGFLTPNIVCLAIWAATGAGAFWPGWVLLFTGIAFAVFLVRYALGVEDDDLREAGPEPPHPPHAPQAPRLPRR